MKKIIIRISEKTDPSKTISNLHDSIPSRLSTKPEFELIFKQIKSCIDDFTAKAIKVSGAGTTIHIEKEIKFSDTMFKIILDSPARFNLLEKIKEYLGLR